MKQAVVTMCRKDSDKFQSQYKGSIGWFNLDHNFLRRNFYTLEPDFYDKQYEKDIEDVDMEPYKTFLVPFYYTKLNLFIRNDPVKNKEKKQLMMMKKNLRVWDHQVIRKIGKGESFGTNLWRNQIT